ncbi:PAS-domain containing protein [Roseomonas sp. CCTCC AB2023176]|uniref:PAS-domain containing protein n=1 Tax=Roseomonas sp. CCTCC AB2023176 TaxID=3342640 RepID=UPI0035DD9CC2
MSEERLRALLDSLPAGVAAYDADGRLLYANPAMWRQAGEDVPALPAGSTLEQVITVMARAGHYGPGDAATRVREGLVLDRGRSRHRLARNVAGRWHELRSEPLPGGGSVSLSVDVTDLHRTEPEAIARAALLDNILQRLSSGVAEYDHKGRLRYFNSAYRSLTGFPPGSLRLGMALAEVFEVLEAAGQLVNLTPEQMADLPRGAPRGAFGRAPASGRGGAVDAVQPLPGGRAPRRGGRDHAAPPRGGRGAAPRGDARRGAGGAAARGLRVRAGPARRDGERGLPADHGGVRGEGRRAP